MVSLAAIFVFGAVRFGKTADDPFLMNSLAFEGEPWRLVANVLPHGDPLHLLFNVYWMWVLGTRLEEELGHVTTLVVFVVLAVGSGAAQYAFSIGGIGLSGIGYGIVGYLAAARRIDPRFRDGIDSRTLQLFAAWFVLCVVLTITNVLPIGNWAHGVGFVLGIPIAYVLAPGPSGRRFGAALLVIAIVGGSVGAAWKWRDVVNLSHQAGSDDRDLGTAELEQKKYEAAIRHLERAVTADPKDANAWYNYGVALQYGAGHLDIDELEAWKKALALDPKDELYRDTVADTLRRQGDMLMRDNKLADAEKTYRASIAVKETPKALFNLGLVLDEVDRHEEAAKMFERAQQLDPSVGAEETFKVPAGSNAGSNTGSGSAQ
jgi:GlpG protein